MHVVRAGRLEAVDEGVGAVIGEFRRGDALGGFALDDSAAAAAPADQHSTVRAWRLSTTWPGWPRNCPR